MLKFYFRQPWPRFPGLSQKYRVIRYCHIDQAIRDALEYSHIRPAMRVWAEALGTVPNGTSGHSLAWKELMTPIGNGDHHPRFYFKERTNQWNEAIAKDTLAIHLVKGATPQATIGYTTTREAGRPQDDPSRGPCPASSSARSEHLLSSWRMHNVDEVQIGHILGMIYEQYRNDRDDYIEYRCENIHGYGQATLDAILAGETDVDIRLCEDKDLAEKYKFDSSQFAKNAGYVDFPGKLDEGDFDMGSIMMYPSNAFSNPECKSDNMDVCPMVGIDKVNGKVTGKSWIHGNVAPTAGDVAFVKKWYPWDSTNYAAQVGTR